MENFKTVIYVIVFLLSASVAIVLVMAPVAYTLGKYKCWSAASAMKIDYKFGLGMGCMVKSSTGQFVPLSSIRWIKERSN